MLHSTPAAGRSRPRRWRRAISFPLPPPRHLEPVLQALVRDGILRGVRGPHGGYEFAREHRRISAEDILRVASAAEEADDRAPPNSALANDVVKPALVEAVRAFSTALGRISVEDMAKQAAALK